MPTHKHTPGPWSVGGEYVYGLELQTIAMVVTESQANARLISAAPDLLAALADAL